MMEPRKREGSACPPDFPAPKNQQMKPAAAEKIKELSPMLLALIFAGRVGSSVTAEIGTMQVSEQLDALKTLYTNPVEYVAVPRFWEQG